MTHEQPARLAPSLSQKAPTPRFFHDAIVTVLGKATRPGHFVHFEEVLDPIILEAGFDPNNLSKYGDPALGWRTEGRQSPPGMYRQLHIGVRYLALSPNCKQKLCRLGPQRGQWGLTRAGSRKALRRNGPNVTARYLDDQFKAPGGMQNSPLYRIMHAAISRRLPGSLNAGLVDDHIQQCVVWLIARDSFRNKLEGNAVISHSAMATFGVNSAINDCRNLSRNPVCREIYGARTDKERKDLENEPDTPRRWQHTDPRVSWTTSNTGTPEMDLMEEQEVSIEEYLDFEVVFQEVVETLQERKALAWERYSNITRKMVVEGYTAGDVQKTEGVSRHRAATILAESRRVLRAARAEGDLSFC